MRYEVVSVTDCGMKNYVKGLVKRNIKITYGSLAAHNAQILTGFDILTEGKCDIANSPDDNLPPSVVVADFGDTLVAYDTSDGYFHTGAIGCDKRYERLSEDVAVLYKRDFNSDINSADLLFKGKIKPLGLNYFCYDDRVRKLYFPGYRILRKTLREFLSIESDENFKTFENTPSKENYSCEVLFLTRLWNPDSKEVENGKIAEERRIINATRIQIISELRKKYGEKAICGISGDEYSKLAAPELIINSHAKKTCYLKIMRNAKIVISSLGLHKSNGWKTGEYFAAGRPIIMEKPFYEIPFADKNSNWLEYTTVEECLSAVDYLLSHENERCMMAYNNAEYYRQHLRPDKLIADTLSSLIPVEK